MRHADAQRRKKEHVKKCMMLRGVVGGEGKSEGKEKKRGKKKC
jgi:hypothetical protein